MALGIKAVGNKVREDVCFGSFADIGACVRVVRFTPESRHSLIRGPCPLSAISGHGCLNDTVQPPSLKSAHLVIKGSQLDEQQPQYIWG
jgi:hypothetical protein